MLHPLDKKYEVPHVEKISSEITKVYKAMTENISKSLIDAEKISLCADI